MLQKTEQKTQSVIQQVHALTLWLTRIASNVYYQYSRIGTAEECNVTPETLTQIHNKLVAAKAAADALEQKVHNDIMAQQKAGSAGASGVKSGKKWTKQATYIASVTRGSHWPVLCIWITDHKGVNE